jgi:hypothetical protein
LSGARGTSGGMSTVLVGNGCGTASELSTQNECGRPGAAFLPTGKARCSTVSPLTRNSDFELKSRKRTFQSLGYLTPEEVRYAAVVLALQLPFLQISESMGNHDSKIVDAASVD